MEFNELEFRNFVISKFITNPNTLANQELLNAICQVEQPLHKVLNILTKNVSRRIRRNLKIEEKHNKVPMNHWLLHLFNFKKCSTCTQILTFDKFNNNVGTWDKLTNQCKNCNANYRQNNKDKINERNKEYKIRLKQGESHILYKKYKNEIIKMYNQSFELNKINKCQVDHIIPISLGGLHLPWNLQILGEKENNKKQNILTTDNIKLVINNIKNYNEIITMDNIIFKTAPEWVKNLINIEIIDENNNK